MKKLRSFLFIISIMLILSPIAICANPATLLGLTLDYDKGEITIHVVGSGCTQKNDFKFDIKSDTLSVLRLRTDDCKAMESEVRFTYKLKEAGINPNKAFIVRNKFIANPFIANIK